MIITNAPCGHEVETQTKERLNNINGLENGQDSESIATRTPDAVFLKRRQRRRLDLRSLAGTLRESARVYREIAEGKISLAEGEVRSRVLGRHKDVLAAIQQTEYLKSIDERLAAIEDERRLPALPPESTEEAS
jgi:hypothetical protein